MKCPCGRGTIQWIHKEDDWNRVVDDCYEIMCADCSCIYYLYKVTHHDSKDGWTSVYCIRSSVVLEPVPSKPTSIDFLHDLIYDYSFKSLKSALSKLSQYSSSSKVPLSEHTLRDLINSCYKYDRTRRMTFLLNKINEAISIYNSVPMNYDEYSSL